MPTPRHSVAERTEERTDRILDVMPAERSKVYDVREIIRCIVDRDSYFELKARFGKSIATGLARLDGRSVGIIANNPKFKGGAIDVDAMRKATSFLVLCDSFNIPLIFLVDQPGFMIGAEGELEDDQSHAVEDQVAAHPPGPGRGCRRRDYRLAIAHAKPARPRDRDSRSRG